MFPRFKVHFKAAPLVVSGLLKASFLPPRDENKFPTPKWDKGDECHSCIPPRVWLVPSKHGWIKTQLL
jgi:hypothetical protein